LWRYVVSKKISKQDIEKKIIDFFKKNPNPSDAKIHTWAEKEGYDVHAVEASIYRLATKFVTAPTTKVAGFLGSCPGLCRETAPPRHSNRLQPESEFFQNFSGSPNQIYQI
jgi:hypothetical protein